MNRILMRLAADRKKDWSMGFEIDYKIKYKVILHYKDNDSIDNPITTKEATDLIATFIPKLNIYTLQEKRVDSIFSAFMYNILNKIKAKIKTIQGDAFHREISNISFDSANNNEITMKYQLFCSIEDKDKKSLIEQALTDIYSNPKTDFVGYLNKAINVFYEQSKVKIANVDKITIEYESFQLESNNGQIKSLPGQPSADSLLNPYIDKDTNQKSNINNSNDEEIPDDEDLFPVVKPGDIVELKIIFKSYDDNEPEDETTEFFEIAKPNQVNDPDNNQLNIDSPVAQAILGKQVDDEVVVRSPGGISYITIKSIKKKETN